MFVTLYPFLYTFSMSISDPMRAIAKQVWLFPKGFSLATYKLAFENQQIYTAYMNTIIYTVSGTSLNLVLTLMGAYALSRKQFFIRDPLMFFIAFTMFFSGGMIPSFLLVTQLGIYNTRWAMILPSAVNAYNLIIARTFFSTISDSLEESAKLDGANDIHIMLRIFIPLSKAIAAVMVLFYAVGHWNSYFNALLYLPSSKLIPLQLFLFRVVVKNETAMMMMGIGDAFERSIATMLLKYAVIIVTILPIICVYPFAQKYFMRGVMIGAIKG